MKTTRKDDKMFSTYLETEVYDGRNSRKQLSINLDTLNVSQSKSFIHGQNKSNNDIDNLEIFKEHLEERNSNNLSRSIQLDYGLITDQFY